MQTAEQDVSNEEIARRAYELWQSRGCPPGDGSQDWQAAEAELRAAKQNGSGLWSWWCRLRNRITGRDM